MTNYDGKPVLHESSINTMIGKVQELNPTRGDHMDRARSPHSYAVGYFHAKSDTLEIIRHMWGAAQIAALAAAPVETDGDTMSEEELRQLEKLTLKFFKQAESLLPAVYPENREHLWETLALVARARYPEDDL